MLQRGILKKQAQQLKKDLPALFLSIRDRETPLVAKFFAGLTLIYALSPIDLVPDFIPVLGCLDDIILLPLLVALTIRFIPKEILDNHRLAAEDLWKDGKPKKWYYGLPIIFLWALIIYVLVKVFK
ncbi:TPA: YkvA family protein [Streptococcus suis]